MLESGDLIPAIIVLDREREHWLHFQLVALAVCVAAAAAGGGYGGGYGAQSHVNVQQ